MESITVPLPATPSLLRPGSRLDRYELLSLVAEGGMASVWVARLFGKHGFEKLVAIKTILPRFAENPQFRRMFLDEAHIASGIEHTNVARILDLGEESGTLYIVMEWVDGDSLNKVQRLLEQKNVSLPIGIVLRVMADACAGLHSAHELRGRDGAPLHVVHRDVSPQNILLSRDGAAKIIDFGIAKALDRTSDDTGSGTLKGKIQYMAPEQALGKPIDRRADVWSIGAVLFGFFTGKQVYEGDGQLVVLQQLTSGKPPPPVPPSVPGPIARVIEGALRLDPARRFPTAQEVQRQIERAMMLVGCVTSASDVAAFVAEHLPERSRSRRETIERSILAAGEPVTIPPPMNQSVVRTRTATTVVTPKPGRLEVSATSADGMVATNVGPRARESRLGWILGALGVLALFAAAVLYASRAGSLGGHPKAHPAPAEEGAPTVAEIRPFRLPAPPSSAEPAATLQPIPVEALPLVRMPAPFPRPSPHPAAAAATGPNAPSSPTGPRPATVKGKDVEPPPPKNAVIDDGF